ncbi:fimbrial assembly protein [Salinibacterium sp. SWN1162]|nr:fimbrial assembly protein [Salinibacterium sp. SWN1162]
MAVGISVLAAVGANIYQLQRAVTLENARSQTLSLTTQQGEYSEVRTASQLLSSTEAARVFAYSTEVSVKGLIDGLNSKLTSDMVVSTYSFDTANPLQAFSPSVSPLDTESMAAFSLEVTGGSVAVIDDWVRKISSVDGVVQATLLSTTREEGSTFSGSVVVLVGDAALLHRFDGIVADAEAADDEAAATETTPAPTNSPEPDSDTNDEENGS